MRNIKLTIEYDGKDFNGWQKQPNKLNIQGTIEKAIESVLNQSFADFELIIVNDGSTDSTLSIIEGFDDSRIRVIDQENLGPGTCNFLK